MSDGVTHVDAPSAGTRSGESVLQLPPPAFSLLGWKVLGTDGRLVGSVRALVVGPAAGRARYLVVALDPAWQVAADPASCIIAPLACARLKPGRNEITLRALPAAECVSLPIYEGGAITADDEAAIWMTCATVAIARDSDILGDEGLRPRYMVPDEMSPTGGSAPP